MEGDHGYTYDLDEFVDRIRERLNYEDLDLESSYSTPSNVDRADTTYRTKAVIALLSETTPGDQIANVERQLPAEFEEPFELVDAETQPWEQSDCRPSRQGSFYSRSIRRPESADS
ncbi:DUF2267 domain-containing protein [Natronococcus roseus]|uniref:DUF2267 domain-containing protein n=1 Tax=Natronococcus roseus TaxID=1052014 RepID=UPI00374CB88E